MGIKTKLGAVCLVVGVTAAALPGLSGVIANNQIKTELNVIAESVGYSVSEINLEQGYAQTQVSIKLAGDGLKGLNGEQVSLSGVLDHGGMTTFPIMVAGAFDVSFLSGEGETELSLSGKAKTKLSWFGREQAELNLPPAVIPVDPDNGSVVAVDEYQIAYDSDNAQADTLNFEVSELSVRIAEAGYEMAKVRVAPSSVSFVPEKHEWVLSAAELAFSSQQESNQVIVTDLVFGGSEQTVSDLASSSGFMSTGSITLAPEGKVLLQSIEAKASLDNISISARSDLMRFVDGAEDADPVAIEKALVELLQSLPRYSLDELKVDTGRGDFSMNFDIAATKKTAAVFQDMLKNPPINEVQEYLAIQKIINNMRSKTEIQVSEDLIGWGCELVSAQQARDPIQISVLAGACEGLVKSGQFLNMACSGQGWQCAEKMEKVRTVWEKSRSLEVVLDEGRMTLNNVEMDIPRAF